MSDDAEDGWSALKEFIGLAGDGPPPRYWGEIERELEVQVDGDGIVLSKGYREHGRGLDHPWLELSEAELRGLLAKGEELLAIMEEEKSRATDRRAQPEEWPPRGARRDQEAAPEGQGKKPRSGSAESGPPYGTSEPHATSVSVSDDALILDLEDGRRLHVPLEWFPRLRDGSPSQRQSWRLIGNGFGVHWPDLDEDICVPRLLGLAD